MKKRMLFGLLLIFNFCLNAQSIKPQIGDEGFVFDESKFDPYYQDMIEWAKAGVEGGIPSRKKTKIIRKLNSIVNLQNEIDEVSAKGGGVILLKKGYYELQKTIYLKSNVILRGENKDKTIIGINMKKEFFKFSQDKKQLVAIEINDAERVGIEDLTIKYSAVDFEPYDKTDFFSAWDRKVFHEHETRDTMLFVHSVIFRRCKNSWVDNCNILSAGAHPIGVGECNHMTLRNNFIDRSYIKKDSFHGGYYGCWGSSYCLFYNETVKRIRHFAIMSPGAKYNVVYKCNFEVDINFHDKDDGNNLVEQCRIATPVWHSWDAIGIGAIGQHQPPGPNNILYNNEAISKGVEGYNRKIGKCISNQVYEVTTKFGEPNVNLSERPVPRFKTFYAVKMK